jgi:uridine kinase
MEIFYFCPKSEEALRQLQKEIEWRKTKVAGPLLLGIGGPGGSGKSKLSALLQERISNSEVLTLDDFRLPRSERPPHAPFGSHPDAMNFPLIRETLMAAKGGYPIHQPHFDLISGTTQQGKDLPLADVYVVDGEVTAYSMLNPYLDILILVQSSLWTQFVTRLNRDRKNRGCSLLKTLQVFVRSNLMDYPRHGKSYKDQAYLVFHRHPRKGFVLKNRKYKDSKHVWMFTSSFEGVEKDESGVL